MSINTSKLEASFKFYRLLNAYEGNFQAKPTRSQWGKVINLGSLDMSRVNYPDSSVCTDSITYSERS